jgi:murein DD-endopeptidase MepM/ murein hydrolase activator NlpD
MVNQRDSTKRNKFITLMILPHNSGREVFRINLPQWLAGILFFFVASAIISLLGFFIYSTTITGRLVHYYALKVENKLQDNQIKAFFERTKKLETGIRELEERDQELREMLGLQKNRKTPVQLNDIMNVTQAKERMASLEQTVIEKLQEYKVLGEASTALAYKFNSYPSLSPVSAPVFQPVGWRIHPFTGRSEFHKGIDIPTWVGCPVRAAADGYATFAGWGKGYGELVMIDHGNGYTSLYGHNSRLLVKQGDRIYKGQVIAKAGSTGLSTGPHVHYEVHHNQSVVNAAQYMDLNIRSARYL